MTDNNRHGVQRFVDRVTQAQDGLGHMQSILTELAAVDERLKSTLQRMEQADEKLQAAVLVLRQLSDLRDSTSSGGFNPSADDNRRNDGQWQLALARLVFGDAQER